MVFGSLICDQCALIALGLDGVFAEHLPPSDGRNTNRPGWLLVAHPVSVLGPYPTTRNPYSPPTMASVL